jgi:hypothetical protein
MGIRKTLLCIGGLMMAAGGPVTVFSTSDLATNVKQKWADAKKSLAPAVPQAAGNATPTVVESAAPATAAAPASTTSDAALPPMPMPSLDDVLRFDVTVEWIMHQWPRVSTGLPYLQLQGYRVPLVTGTSYGDVAGALTYYFNAQQKVERITFRGATGDPRILVGIVTGRYQFARRLTNDPGLVLFEAVNSSDKPTGTLKIRSASVIKANQPYTKYDVDLVMDRAE